jgi:hypothetical protein
MVIVARKITSQVGPMEKFKDTLNLRQSEECRKNLFNWNPTRSIEA